MDETLKTPDWSYEMAVAAIDEGIMELDPIPLSSPMGTLTQEDSERSLSASPKKKRKRVEEEDAASSPEGKEASKGHPGRKARVFLTQAEADNATDTKGRYVMQRDKKGKFDAYALRTFVVSMRKHSAAAAAAAAASGGDSKKPSKSSPKDSVTVLLVGAEGVSKELTLPLHGRNAKRTPGAAKTRAHSILNTLRKHGVINGRYVSVLRDFGYGGNSAHKLVSSYLAEYGALAQTPPSPQKEEEAPGGDSAEAMVL